jgi:CRISPR-associated endonuclease Csn1
MANVDTASATQVWAFDLGKASLGEAIRHGNEIIHASSWLIPEDFARRGPATKPGSPANRYRAWRTREAHLAREARLREILQESGIEVLAARDPRLTREFPAKGDETCYASCLLRIQLLRGAPLAGWQIHKALHSAIQRRGYDRKPAWMTKRSERSEKSKEDSETEQRLGAYQNCLEQMAGDRTEFHFPCYLDAWRLGLWSPESPDHYNLRIDHHAAPARNRDYPDVTAIVAPRDLVEAEVRALLETAAKLVPALADKASLIIHGPGGQRYASYYPNLRIEHGLREGGSNDWLGILGQKIPRFDNRIIAKCALLPRLNVCKASIREDANGIPYPDSLLPSEVTFLLKLKNVRVQRIDKRATSLTSEEIRNLFNDPKRPPGKLDYGKKEWKNQLTAIGAVPTAGQEKIDAPKEGGRSRFSRPALQILKRLILSGESPSAAYARELAALGGNTDQRKGLVPDDLKFMLRMGDTWEGLYVPDQQHDALLRLRDEKGRDTAIQALIGSVNDPIVRHRLEIFWTRIKTLEETYGTPGEIVLEFVRDDFLGVKAKSDLQKFQNDREKARKDAREKARELNATGRAAGLKYELLKQQGGVCLYTNQGLATVHLDDLQIEHIVPRAQGGPDAVVNYVLTTLETNKEKGDRTPYQWFEAKGFAGWDAYVKRVNDRVTDLRNKKVKLLTSHNAAELVRRYTALAETAWIARLAQTLVALYFGWPIRSEEGERRITIVSGGLTARVRRLYKLNSLLHGRAPQDIDPLEWEEQCDKKNRDDDRHHALDAMVLSFIPGWARDTNKEGFFRLPKEVTRETFAQKIATVIPQNLVFAKPELDATIYGRRTLDGHDYGVSRKPLDSFVVSVDMSGKKRSIKPRKSIDTSTIVDGAIRRQLDTFLEKTPDLTLEQWDAWCANFKRGGESGPRVKKILRTITKPDALEEYADLSKDQSGQLRKGGQHRGYFIVEVAKPTKTQPDKRGYEVRPVYTHQSIHKLTKKLKEETDTHIIGFFESGCLVQINQDIHHAKTPLKPGVYRLNSIWEQGNAEITDSASKKSAPIGIAKLVAAGFRRVP